jgi:hypothetical protein
MAKNTTFLESLMIDSVVLSFAAVALVWGASTHGLNGVHRRSWLLVVAVLLVLCPMARSQELAGTFTGTVTDASGGVIPHATVTITLNGVSGESRVVQSNEAGNYTATNLPAGTYTIKISDANFETFSDENVVLNVAQKRTVNAQLKVIPLQSIRRAALRQGLSPEPNYVSLNW